MVSKCELFFKHCKSYCYFIGTMLRGRVHYMQIMIFE
nr:MAG TPA: hypothetical protein [Caudoviricetes sp.]